MSNFAFPPNVSLYSLSLVSNIVLHYGANMRNVTNDQANIVTGLNINIVTAERRTNMLSRRIADI